jgi:hypothetical protein
MGLAGGRKFWTVVAAAAFIAGAAGCSAPKPPPNIADADPQVKIAGIKQAAERKDRSALPALVEQLNSDDPAVRFFAIEALERFTGGDRLGYAYWADDEERKPAVGRWQEWLRRQEVVRAGER